ARRRPARQRQTARNAQPFPEALESAHRAPRLRTVAAPPWILYFRLRTPSPCEVHHRSRSPVRGGPKKVRILRALIRDQPGHLGKLAQALGEVGANIGDITKLRVAGEYTARDFEIYIDDDAQLERLRSLVAKLDGITLESV